MFRIPIVVSFVGLWLTAGFCITEAAGQESQTDSAAPTPSPRIVWQQELDGEIWPRKYSAHFYPNNIYEPNVGIDLDSTRANPVRMVATTKWVYLFDGEGRIERSIPLKREPRPDEVKALTVLTVDDYIEKVGDKKFFIEESAVTDPNGRFYIIRREKTRGYDGWQTENFRAYNADGSLRFELRNRSDEGIYIHSEFYLSPNGEYLVLFPSVREDLAPSLDFYDTTTGALLKHMDQRALRQADIPYSRLTFSESGDLVLLMGGDKERTAILDGQGNLIQPLEGARAKLMTAPQAQHEMRQASYRQLVDPQVPLGARPKEVGDVKMLPGRKRGVYTSGNTLYLFELKPWRM